jgi:hypothetical protein
MLGILSKAYRNTGSYSSPTWSEITLIGDASVDETWKEGDATVRLARNTQMAKTVADLEFTPKVRSDLTDANFQAIWAAAQNDTIIDMMILNGPSTTSGVVGFRFDSQVFKGKEDQGPDKVLFYEFSFKPTLSSNPAKYVIVSGGAPTYTSLGS